MATETRKRGRPPMALPQGIDRPNAFALWVKEKGFTVDVLTRLFNVTRSSIYGWRRGNRPPRRQMAALIEQVSGGAVPADSWDKDK